MGIADELNHISKEVYEKGRIIEAKKEYTRVLLDGLRSSANFEELALGYAFISFVSSDLGELKDALGCCRSGLMLTRNNELRAKIYLNMIYTLGQMGQLEEALSAAESAVVTAKRAGAYDLLETARKYYALLQRN